MHRKRRRPSPHYVLNIGLSFVVLLVFSITGIRVANQTLAATTNPYGFADYCTLENNTTVIYGWASDPNATSLTQPSVTVNAGGKALTVPTNIAGFRDARINIWIDKYRAGDPKPGTYGFKAAFTGLYKGSAPTISGTVLNVGAGSSVILTINNDRPVDGDASKPYFAGNKIPDVCLANAPAPPPPPAPAPTTPPPTTTAPTAPTKPAAPKPAPAPAPVVSSSADATVTVGTLAAEFKIPSGNAKTVKVTYGSTENLFDQSSHEVQTVDGSATIMLNGLTAGQTYYYHIVRTNGLGKTTASPPAKFDTLGYVAALHFVDTDGNGLANIPVSINVQKDQKRTDDNGNVQFTGVPEGTHTITYTFNDKKYTEQLTANRAVVPPEEANQPAVITIDLTVNVEDTIATKQPEKQTADNGIVTLLIVGSMVLLAIGLAAYAFIRRRRQQQYYDQYYDDIPASQNPDYQTVAPPPPMALPADVQPVPIIPPPGAAHMGESLKEMVMRSMAEEAHRRAEAEKANTNKPGGQQ